MQVRRFLTVFVLALIASVAVVATASNPASADSGNTGQRTAQGDGQTVRMRLSQALAFLTIEAEVTGSYDRSLYNFWTHQGAGCDTRDSVLLDESQTDIEWIGDACSYEGQWRSYYDGNVTTDPRDVFVTHVVGVEEAHNSGGFRWSPEKREAYANDLGDTRTLAVVTIDVARSKGGSDPSEWVPPMSDCRYVRDWVAVKIRWGLSVDRREYGALRDLASGCADRWMHVDLYTGE